MDNKTLVKTLDFQLDIQSDNEGRLYDATVEARRVYNETIRLAKECVDWDAISPRLEGDADLVKNTTQRIVAKALDAMDNYDEYDDFGKPSHSKSGPYPLRANFTEGHTLSLTSDGDVAFRISAKPYNHVKRILEGGDAHLDLLKSALTATSGSSRPAKPSCGTVTLNSTSTSATPSRPSETSRTHELSSAWM